MTKVRKESDRMKQFFIRNIVFAIFHRALCLRSRCSSKYRRERLGVSSIVLTKERPQAKCKVTNVDEVVTNRELVAFYGAGAKSQECQDAGAQHLVA